LTSPEEFAAIPCQNDAIQSREGKLTGLGDAKKSISLPIVKGTLIDTADESSRRPMAISKGFRSGLASANIRCIDETDLGPFPSFDGRKRVNMLFFCGAGVCDSACVELNRTSNG